MKVLVTESFNTAKGNIPAGKVIEIPETMFDRLRGKVKAIPHETNTTIIWQNPYPAGTPEAREYTLSEMMGEMVQTTCDSIVEEHNKRGIPSYVSNPEIHWAEDEITRVYHKVLGSEANLADFHQALETWEQMVGQVLNYKSTENELADWRGG